MIIGESLPFIRDYVASINEAIKKQDSGKELTRLQCYWLSFVILGILVTNSVCWARLERFGAGGYRLEQLSWMFRRAKILWELLLKASVLHLLSVYKIKEGVLVIDDTDKERSKNTTEIAKVHKIKDKKTNGYFKGQNLVFLLLVTQKITVPVGFYFHEPDPKRTAWRKEEARLKKTGVAKQYRPEKPAADEKYPGKKTLALNLLSDFVKMFPDFIVRAVAVDAYYGMQEFMEEAKQITQQKQIISQVRKNQLIIVNNKEIAVDIFFKNYQGHQETILLRGKDKKITYCSGKFKVKSHKKKYFVIALKYEGEEEYRYLIAQDMSWRDIDIIKTYALRWLVETFIQDWKSYEGWNQMAKQTGFDGSNRGVILSLLCDHALLLHSEQQILLEKKQPALTVGSLREKVMMESIKSFIEGIVMSADPKAMFMQYSERISEAFGLHHSVKHLCNVDMEFLQPML
jgi:hypothetical protein